MAYLAIATRLSIKTILLLWFFLCLPLQAAPHDFKRYQNIQWAAPDNYPLTMDIYVPQTGHRQYPVLVIYHGGGWLINDNSIMDSMAGYIASHGNYIVANVNYRLLADQHNTVTMPQIIGDVFGSLLWIKEHIGQYSGDATRIAVTGDSAGGHLASMIITSGRKLSSQPFGDNNLRFRPSYLPADETAEQIAARDGLKVQAAIISYGAFDLSGAATNGFETASNVFWQMAKASPRSMFGESITVQSHPAYYQAVSPVYNIPAADDYRLPPQFLHVAENDRLTTPQAIAAYVDKLQAAGQHASYKVYPGRNHAFLDNGCNEFLKICFDRDAPAALQDMLAFLDKALQ
ncbi:alpha/beta hydrolase [Chromatiaceae bacterium AAb-1]|nr:alpha/beta hydrolase [Chromatiaceae bacterium AAb-1]